MVCGLLYSVSQMGGVLIAVIEDDRIVLAGTHRIFVPCGDLGFRVSLSVLHIRELSE